MEVPEIGEWELAFSTLGVACGCKIRCMSKVGGLRIFSKHAELKPYL